MNDQQFLEQFERLELPPEQFDHRGHLRLAWLYLRRFPLDDSIAKLTRGIAAYAASLGATDKFKHTLTEAITRIVAARMARGSYADLDSFLDDNPDLVRDMGGVVARHYSHGVITSARAATTFVAPDLEPLPEVT